MCALCPLPFDEFVDDLLGVFGSDPPPSDRGGGCKDLTLFCRDWVVAVAVDTRAVESAAPETAEVVEGWMVLRLLALLRLAFRTRDGFSEVGSVPGC